MKTTHSQVEVAGVGKISAELVAGTLVGTLLPLQVLYEGKTE